jgi:predicted nucleic acid-binding protein
VRCTLVDTGPLVALLDDGDALHARALKELAAAPKPRLLCPPVMTEAIHLLGSVGYPDRLHALVDQDTLRFEVAPAWPLLASQAIGWMRRYVEHEPDFTDAYLVAWCENEPSARVWTFDSEVKNVWRTSKGKALRLVGGK